MYISLTVLHAFLLVTSKVGKLPLEMEQVAHWNTHYSLHSLSALSTVNDFFPSFLYLSSLILTYNKFIPSLAQLRNHLNNAIKHQGQPNAVNLTNPETLQLHLETRLAQLESAINMELWQVCHIIREKQSLHSEALNSACSCSVNGIFTNSFNSSNLCCRYTDIKVCVCGRCVVIITQNKFFLWSKRLVKLLDWLRLQKYITAQK